MAHPLPDRWTESLPLVLLGIRSSVKEDLKCSSAELVYGSTLRLPGEFFIPPPESSVTDTSSYLSRLHACASTWKPTSPRPAQFHSYIPKDLSLCSHVFIRHDSYRTPLQAKYDGPFLVLKKKEKYFSVRIRNQTENISVDRLKPAFFETTFSTSLLSPITTNSPTLTVTYSSPLPSLSLTSPPPRSSPHLSLPSPPPPPPSPPPLVPRVHSSVILPVVPVSSTSNNVFGIPSRTLLAPSLPHSPPLSSSVVSVPSSPSSAIQDILRNFSRSGRRIRPPVRFLPDL